MKKEFYFYLSIISLIQAQFNEWCWTLPDLKVKVQADKFGYNWGQCQSKTKEEVPKQQYTIQIKIPDVQGYTGEKGPFYMTISNNEMQGIEFLLKKQAFMPGETWTIKQDLPPIDNIKKVSIRKDNRDSQLFLNLVGLFICESINVIQNYQNWGFQCSDVMDQNTKILQFYLDEYIQYDIDITTENNSEYHTDKPIFIQLEGDKESTSLQLLSGKGLNQMPFQTQLMMKNIEKIKCVHLKAYSLDEYKPINIKIQKKDSGIFEIENILNQIIQCPNHCKISFCKGIQDNIELKQLQFDPYTDINELSLNKDDEGQINLALFNGMQLTWQEKEKIKTLKCNTKASDIIEVENFIGNNINFHQIYGICPNGCSKDSFVFGRGIHHKDSQICASGIADGTIPKTGGIIGIAKIKGQEFYNKFKLSNGIKIRESQFSEFSFTTFKVDNVDFSKSDIRILNYKGEIDFLGRVEFRINGKWGSVSIKGSEQLFAQQVCRTLNYKDGQILNELQQQFCLDYKEQNWCGENSIPVHYSHYTCDQNVNNLIDCQRQIDTEQDHDNDVIIECSMENFKDSSNNNPPQGAIRIMGTNGAPSQDTIGRVEIFVKNQWGTVCNIGWNSNSANVACRQMGFLSGKSIGKPGEYNACLIGQNDYCLNQDKPLLIDNLNCQGHETKILQCGGGFKPKCGGPLSAMVNCEGIDGDSTGESQKKTIKIKTPKPKLGVLPLANPYAIDCKYKLNSEQFSGDPGSIYLVFCPQGCVNDETKVIGTGIYSYDSSICKAAIHSGVLQNSGGIVTITITYGQQKYFGSLNRNIESESFLYSKKSFTIVNSYIISLKQFNFTRNQVQLCIMLQLKKNYTVNLYLFYNQKVTFIYKDKFIRKNSKLISDLFRDYLKQVSFIQTSKMIFEWLSPIQYKFNEKTDIDTDKLEKTDVLQTIKSFTIFLQFQLEEKIERAEIFGHSECDCWGLLITDRGLEFGQKCTNNFISFGYQVALNKKYNIALIIDNSQQNVQFWVDKDLIYEDKKTFDFQCHGKVQIGYNSFSNSDVFLYNFQRFIGNIDYIQVYDKPLSQIDVLKKLSSTIPIIGINPQNLNSDNTIVLRQTLDFRKCVSECLISSYPGQKNSPEPPQESILGQALESDKIQDEFEDDLEKEDSQKPISENSISFQCEDNLTQEQYDGDVGQEYRIYCPKGCAQTKHFVLGSQFYHKFSSVCKAAIHNGVIQNINGGYFIYKKGEIILELQNPIKYYQGTFQNDIMSLSFQSEDLKKSFVIKKADQVYKIKCNTKGNDPIFKNKHGISTVFCPERCSFQVHQIWGIKKYSEDSSICQAAIHSGHMNDKGGNTQIQFKKPINIYESATIHQIKSSTKVNQDLQLSSFITFGNFINTCGYFREVYNPSQIDQNWDVQDKQALNGPSIWSFQQISIQGISKTVITQQSKIENINPGQFGTLLVHKNFDCSDGVFKLNIFYEKIGEIAIMIRYYDENNYYILKLNVQDQKSLQFYKVNNGIENEICKYIYKSQLSNNFILILLFGIVYSYNSKEHRLVFIYKQYFIIKQGNYRNIPLIFDISDSDLQRGKIAIGTNKEAKVYFDGIQLSQIDILNGIMDAKSQQQRNWDQCLKPSSLIHREKICRSLMGNNNDRVIACKKILNFCQICCYQIISSWEKILNYGCQKSCVQATREKENDLRKLQQSDEEQQYMPKNGDKIDFMPKHSKFFLYANIKKVIFIQERSLYKIEISYRVQGDEFKKEEVLYPSERIQKCGQVLTGRDDCKL